MSKTLKEIKAKPIEEFNNIADLKAECEESGEPNIIVNDSIGRLIVMPLSQYQEEEKAYDAELLKRLERGTEDLKNGNTVDGFVFLEELKQKYGF